MNRVILASFLQLLAYTQALANAAMPIIEEYHISWLENATVTLNGTRGETCSLMEFCLDSAPVSMYYRDRQGYRRIDPDWPWPISQQKTCDSNDTLTACQYSYNEAEFDESVQRPRRSFFFADLDGVWSWRESSVQLRLNTSAPESATFVVVSGPVQNETKDPCASYKKRSYCKEPSFGYLHVELFAYKKYGSIKEPLDVRDYQYETSIRRRMAELVGVQPRAQLFQEVSFPNENPNSFFKLVYKIPYYVGMYSRITKIEDGDRVFKIDSTTEIAIKSIYLFGRYNPTDIVHLQPGSQGLSQLAIGGIVLGVALALGVLTFFVVRVRKHRKDGYQSIHEDSE